MGSHFKLVDSQTVDLTPDLAITFSTMPASVSERDLKPKRLDYLKDRLLSGHAISFNWARAKVVDTGEVFRVNGHHSSNMLAGLNGAFPAGLKVHIDDYEVEHKEALALLFRQFDSRVSARTIDDISGVYQGLQAGLAGVTKNVARKAIEGIAWYKDKIVGFDPPKGDDRYNFFFDQGLHPFILLAGQVCSIKTPEFTLPVMGAMFGTWEREPTWAETFWNDVAKAGGDNAATHPSTVLDAWLVAATKEKDDKPRAQEIYRACVLAWNTNRHGRSLNSITKNALQKTSLDID
jgi:hypothetical protein